MLAFDHAYISKWYSQGSGESAHMRRRARTFATRLHKIWMQLNTQTLTNLSLASFLWDICKQWIPRLDAAQFGVWSGSPLFAYRMFYQHLNKDENCYSTTIQTEIDWPRNSIRHKWIKPVARLHSVLVGFYGYVMIKISRHECGYFAHRWAAKAHVSLRKCWRFAGGVAACIYKL